MQEVESRVNGVRLMVPNADQYAKANDGEVFRQTSATRAQFSGVDIVDGKIINNDALSNRKDADDAPSISQAVSMLRETARRGRPPNVQAEVG